MELLIPGLILVALMVYASTRIKKTAAMAFAPETVENDEFIIQKPEGFLNVIGGDSQYAFEAYSKDFGTDDPQEFRQGTAKLRIYDNVTIDSVVDQIRVSGTHIISELKEVIGDVHYRMIETKRTENEVGLRTFYKVGETNGRVFVLEVTALAEATDEFIRNIESMLITFQIK